MRDIESLLNVLRSSEPSPELDVAVERAFARRPPSQGEVARAFTSGGMDLRAPRLLVPKRHAMTLSETVEGWQVTLTNTATKAVADWPSSHPPEYFTTPCHAFCVAGVEAIVHIMDRSKQAKAMAPRPAVEKRPWPDYWPSRDADEILIFMLGTGWGIELEWTKSTDTEGYWGKGRWQASGKRIEDPLPRRLIARGLLEQVEQRQKRATFWLSADGVLESTRLKSEPNRQLLLRIA